MFWTTFSSKLYALNNTALTGDNFVKNGLIGFYIYMQALSFPLMLVKHLTEYNM